MRTQSVSKAAASEKVNRTLRRTLSLLQMQERRWGAFPASCSAVQEALRVTTAEPGQSRDRFSASKHIKPETHNEKREGPTTVAPLDGDNALPTTQSGR